MQSGQEPGLLRGSGSCLSLSALMSTPGRDLCCKRGAKPLMRLSEQGLHPCGGTGTPGKGIPQVLALHAEDSKWGAEALPPQCRASCLAVESNFTEGNMGAVKWGVVYSGSQCPMPHTPAAGLASQRFPQTNPLCLHPHESLLAKPTRAVLQHGDLNTPLLNWWQ